jgi:hypothetical protein
MGRANQFDLDSAVRILRLVDAGKSRLAPAEREALCRVAMASLMGERLSDAELLWARSVMARYRSADVAQPLGGTPGEEASRLIAKLAQHKRVGAVAVIAAEHPQIVSTMLANLLHESMIRLRHADEELSRGSRSTEVGLH